MKQTIQKILLCIAIIGTILGMYSPAICSEKTIADLVVYGKIFTSENNQKVEAFAVKNGKYIYM